LGKNDRSTLAVCVRSRGTTRAPRVPDVAPWQSRVSPGAKLLMRRRWSVFVDALEKQPETRDTRPKERTFPPNTRLIAGNMAAVTDLDMSMLTYSARLATFNTEHQLTKRRASNQKKKQPSAVSWPHESPSGEEVLLTPSSVCIFILTSPARSRRLLLQTRARQRRQCPMFPLRRETRRMGEPGCPPPRASGPLSTLLHRPQSVRLRQS
jgi:cytochrome c5